MVALNFQKAETLPKLGERLQQVQGSLAQAKAASKAAAEMEREARARAAARKRPADAVPGDGKAPRPGPPAGAAPSSSGTGAAGLTSESDPKDRNLPWQVDGHNQRIPPEEHNRNLWIENLLPRHQMGLGWRGFPWGGEKDFKKQLVKLLML